MLHPAVVTGPASGIGRWIALGLAQAGHPLVLVTRDRARGASIRDWITQHAPAAAIDIIPADLSSVAETEASARTIAARHPRLAVLVNNAGTFRARRERTREGRDLVLAVNLLAPFILMRDLAPMLAGGAPSRIVTVGSSTSDRAGIDPAQLELGRSWTMTRAYAQSKLAVMMVTFEAARRLRAQRIDANVVHPGLVATSLIRTPGPIGLVWRLMAPFARTEQDGARTPLHAALAPALAGTTGHYFKDAAASPPNPRALDPALCRDVWDATERLLTATTRPAAPLPPAPASGPAAGHPPPAPAATTATSAR